MAVPLPGLTQVIKCRAIFRALGQSGIVGGAWRVASIGGSGLTLAELAIGWLAVVQARFPGAMSIHAVLNAVQLELLDNVTSRVSQSVIIRDSVTLGGNGGALVPTQVASVVAKGTGFAGPRFRGRVYWPFLWNSAVSANGEIDPTSAGFIQVAVGFIFGSQTITSGGNSTTLQAVLLHSPRRLPAITLSTDITDFNTTLKFGTQKRRGDYGKLNAEV